jgi:hypothetical protein
MVKEPLAFYPKHMLLISPQLVVLTSLNSEALLSDVNTHVLLSKL